MQTSEVGRTVWSYGRRQKRPHSGYLISRPLQTFPCGLSVMDPSHVGTIDYPLSSNCQDFLNDVRVMNNVFEGTTNVQSGDIAWASNVEIAVSIFPAHV